MRDEILAFIINAKKVLVAFIDRNQGAIDPLYLAILTKVMPRLSGSGAEFRDLLHNLLGWSGGTACLNSHRQSFRLPDKEELRQK